MFSSFKNKVPFSDDLENMNIIMYVILNTYHNMDVNKSIPLFYDYIFIQLNLKRRVIKERINCLMQHAASVHVPMRPEKLFNNKKVHTLMGHLCLIMCIIKECTCSFFMVKWHWEGQTCPYHAWAKVK